MSERYTLLLVDDDPDFLDTASLVLADRFVCRPALSGEKALAQDLRAIDAVLLDIELGHGIDGFETLAILREREPTIPVLMISRREDHGSVERARRLGACDYVGKQFSLRELAARVERAIGQAREQAGEESRGG